MRLQGSERLVFPGSTGELLGRHMHLRGQGLAAFTQDGIGLGLNTERFAIEAVNGTGADCLHGTGKSISKSLLPCGRHPI